MPRLPLSSECGTCQFCGQSAPAERQYLSVSRIVYEGLGHYRESLNLWCPACPECVARGAWLGKRLARLAMLSWVLVPAALLGTSVPLLEWTAPNALGEGVVVLLALSLLVSQFLIARIGARRDVWVREFLGTDLDHTIRRYAAVPHWGAYAAFSLRRHLRHGEVAIPAVGYAARRG